MTSISNDNAALESLGLRSVEQLQTTQEKDDLGLDTFLELMTTQLKNQDPMKPMENGDFLGQIAQFASVSGLQQLNDNFSSLSSSLSSSQALQAGGLVGRRVLMEGQYAPLSSVNGLEGELNLTASATDVRVKVYDAAGSLIKTLGLGDQAQGQVNFRWDGSMEAGGSAPPGTYRLEADFNDGDVRSPLATQVFANVESVVVGRAGEGLSLNLAGLGAVPFNSVSRIQ
jgi:flagellar basal-body rod modification protein FlgD